MGEQYFAKHPSSVEKTSHVSVVLRGHNVSIQTVSGVFSKKKIDYGTTLLVEKMILDKGFKKILDLGCGTGIIGLIIAKELPESQIILSDINVRAVKTAKKNLNGVRNARVVQSDLFKKINTFFDFIVTNPPIRQGLKFNYELINQAYAHLNSGGVFQIVARHNKGGSRLQEHMKKTFGNVRTVAKKGGYRIYFSQKK